MHDLRFNRVSTQRQRAKNRHHDPIQIHSSCGRFCLAVLYELQQRRYTVIGTHLGIVVAFDGLWVVTQMQKLTV